MKRLLFFVAIMVACLGVSAQAVMTEKVQERLGIGRMKGVRILNMGDSVAYGHSSNGVGYADLIADMLDGTVWDYAVSGFKLSQIYKQLQKAIAAGHEPDVVMLEGGLNDMTNGKAFSVSEFEEKGIGMGEFHPYDYSTPDGTTFTAMVERIMYDTKMHFPYALPIWVMTNRTSYRDAELQDLCYKRIAECARKWGIVVVDLFHDGPLNAQLKDICPGSTDWDRGAGGTHPLLEGYKRGYVPAIFDAMQRYYPMK